MFRLTSALLIAALFTAVAAQAAAAAEGAAEGDGMQIEGRTTRAEIAEVVVEQSVDIAAPPAQVYDAFVRDMGRWWSSGFIMGGAMTTDVTIDDSPGGLWMEVWGDRGGKVWGNVITVNRGSSITISLPEGIVWSGAGSIVIDFTDGPDGGTTLKLTHTSFQAYSEDGHSGYIYGWTELLGNGLKKFVETGSVEGSVRP